MSPALVRRPDGSYTVQMGGAPPTAGGGGSSAPSAVGAPPAGRWAPVYNKATNEYLGYRWLQGGKFLQSDPGGSAPPGGSWTRGTGGAWAYSEDGSDLTGPSGGGGGGRGVVRPPVGTLGPQGVIPAGYRPQRPAAPAQPVASAPAAPPTQPAPAAQPPARPPAQRPPTPAAPAQQAPAPPAPAQQASAQQAPAGFSATGYWGGHGGQDMASPLSDEQLNLRRREAFLGASNSMEGRKAVTRLLMDQVKALGGNEMEGGPIPSIQFLENQIKGLSEEKKKAEFFNRPVDTAAFTNPGLASAYQPSSFSRELQGRADAVWSDISSRAGQVPASFQGIGGGGTALAERPVNGAAFADPQTPVFAQPSTGSGQLQGRAAQAWRQNVAPDLGAIPTSLSGPAPHQPRITPSDYRDVGTVNDVAPNPNRKLPAGAASEAPQLNSGTPLWPGSNARIILDQHLTNRMPDKLRQTDVAPGEIAPWQLTNAPAIAAPREEPTQASKLAALAAVGEKPEPPDFVLAAAAGNPLGTRGGQFKPGNTVNLGFYNPDNLDPLNSKYNINPGNLW